MRLFCDDSAKDLLAQEPELLEQARQGSRRAFATLVERYWDRLYRWLYHLTHDRHNAEDLTQEAFTKALANLDKFRLDENSNFRAWLFRIAHNAFVNQARRGRPRKPLPDNLAAHDDGPVEESISRESFEVLARAVNRLPTEFRAAFLLRAEEDLSFRQIADILGLTEETARWRVFKARQKLLQDLAPQLDREKA